MPDPYVNPDRKPAVGALTWVPNIVPNGSSAPFGYNNLTLQRGSFRNDVPNRPGTVYEKYSGSVRCVIVYGTAETKVGSENWPILSAFRPYARPSLNLGDAPQEPFVLKGSGLRWEVQIGATGGSSAKLSSVTFRYALTIDLSDTAAITALTLTDAERQSIKDYQAGIIDRPIVDWGKSKFGRVGVVYQDGTTAYFPANDDKGNPVELGLTDYEHRVTNQETGLSSIISENRSLTIKFGKDKTGTDLKLVKAFFIEDAKSIDSLRLTLYKVLLFDYKRCNFQDNMLPCTYLSYAYKVQFSFDPTRGSGIYPTGGIGGTNSPNLHIKFFSPEDRGGTIGMSHSINLRFLILSLPVYGLTPGGTTLAGLLTDIAAPSFYYTMFIGPTAGKRSLRFSLTPKVSVGSSDRVLLLDDSPTIDTRTESLTVQKQNRSGDTWYTINSYAISGTPTVDPVSGPIASPMLLLDQGNFVEGDESGVKSTDKYRVVQNLAVGLKLFGPTIQNQLYSERSVLQMVASSDTTPASSVMTLKRHITLKSDLPGTNPLFADPLLVFRMEDANSLVSPLTITRGGWRFKIRAACRDTNELVHTHLMVRFWFQPTSEAVIVGQPHKYRPDTEFYFASASSLGQLSPLRRGTPTSLSDVMVSPPLSSTLSDVELVRYVDTIEVDGKQTNSWNLPFGTDSGVLMVGVYGFSIPTNNPDAVKLNKNSLNPPQIILEIDSATSFVETTIQQTLSNTIFAQRVPLFNYTNFSVAESPLVLTRLISGSGEPDLPVNSYAPTTTHFQKPTNTSGSDFSAFTGLMLITEGTTALSQKVVIPVTQVSNKKVPDIDVSVSADFVTDFLPLTNGRVDVGNWRVLLQLQGDVDTHAIAMDLKLEAMLLSQDGTVTERLFSSLIKDGLSASAPSGNIEFTWVNDIPFLIGGIGTQLLLRVTCYPHSRDGNSVTINDLQKQLPDGSIVGVRIDALTLTAHTLKRLVISNSGGDSAAGSAGFWENLKIIPNQSLDSQQFWYIASQDNTQLLLTPFDQPRPIDGTLYGPAWRESYPLDMEVDVRSAGLGEPTLWLRTVLGNTTSSEDRVSATQESRSGAIHVVHAVTSDSVTSQAEGDISGMMVNHLVFDTPYDLPNQSGIVQGLQGQGLSKMSGYRPDITVVRRSGADSGQGALVSLVAQVDSTDGPAVRSAINISSGVAKEWTEPNISLAGGNFAQISRIARELTHPVHCAFPAASAVLLAGWIKPGAIFVRVQDTYASGSTGEPDIPHAMLLIDGNSSPETGGLPFDVPEGVLTGTAVETFPAIACLPAGEALVIYAIEGQDGILYGRTIRGDLTVGDVLPLVNLRTQAGTGSSVLAITGPVAATGITISGVWVAFWCSGKILVTRVDVALYSGVLEPCVLVAGSRNFNKTDNKGNSLFSQMQANKSLYVNQGGAEEDDVPQQCPGLVVSEKHPHQGKLLVYYKDSQNHLRQRIVDFYDNVSEPLIYSQA